MHVCIQNYVYHNFCCSLQGQFNVSQLVVVPSTHRGNLVGTPYPDWLIFPWCVCAMGKNPTGWLHAKIKVGSCFLSAR